MKAKTMVAMAAMVALGWCVWPYAERYMNPPYQAEREMDGKELMARANKVLAKPQADAGPNIRSLTTGGVTQATGMVPVMENREPQDGIGCSGIADKNRRILCEGEVEGQARWATAEQAVAAARVKWLASATVSAAKADVAACDTIKRGWNPEQWVADYSVCLMEGEQAAGAARAKAEAVAARRGGSTPTQTWASDGNYSRDRAGGDEGKREAACASRTGNSGCVTNSSQRR